MSAGLISARCLKPSRHAMALVLASIALAPPVLTNAATASDTRGAAEPGAPTPLEEVVVTAQKREERLQDVPLAISALGATEIANRGVKDLLDLARAVPGISFAGSETGRATFAIRGISTTTEVPTVALFIDDVPISSRFNEITGAVDPDILDVDRVEVLKGPQGTLYGGSAMGGALKFITNAPDLNKEAVNAGGEVGMTENGAPSYEVTSTANIPAIPGVLAFRVAGRYREEGGYVDRIAHGVALNQTQAEIDPATGNAIGLGPDGRPTAVDPATGYATSVPPQTTTSLNSVTRDNINSSRRLALRASALYAPNDSLTITPTAYYQRNISDDFGFYWGNLPSLTTSTRTPENSNDAVQLYTLTLVNTFVSATLTSITSLMQRDQRFHEDYSFYVGGLADVFASLLSYSSINSHFRYWTQEVRLASSRDSALKWTAGLFYQQENDDFGFAVNTVGASGLGIPPVNGVADIVYETNVRKTLDQYAGFADATYGITAKLDVSLGVRVFRIEQSIDRLAEGLFAGGSFGFQKTTSENGATPKVSASYKVTPENMLYATVSQGFRAGGLNNGVPEDLCAADLARIGLRRSPNEYDSDSLWNYEIGTKNRLADGYLTLNAAGYYINWSRLQQQLSLPNCGFTFTANVGRAESKGAELELQARVTEALVIGSAVTLTDAKITSSLPGTGASDGDRMLTTPKWILQANADYKIPVGHHRALFLRGDYQYRTDQFRTFDKYICRAAPGAVADPQRPVCTGVGEIPVANPSQVQGAYGSANLAFGLESASWTTQLYVNNLFDERPVIDRTDLLFTDRRTTLRPRTVGVRVQTTY